MYVPLLILVEMFFSYLQMLTKYWFSYQRSWLGWEKLSLYNWIIQTKQSR